MNHEVRTTGANWHARDKRSKSRREARLDTDDDAFTSMGAPKLRERRERDFEMQSKGPSYINATPLGKKSHKDPLPLVLLAAKRYVRNSRHSTGQAEAGHPPQPPQGE